jgi:hypothetical protein
MHDVRNPPAPTGRLQVTDRAIMSPGYLLARAYVLACGLFAISAVVASQGVMPELYYDQGPVPPWQNRIVDGSVGLAYALLLLLPYRWSVRGWAFHARLALLLLASLWLCYGVATGMYDLAQGRKHWLIVIASVLALGLAILAPATLVIRRKQAACRTTKSMRLVY